MVSPELLPTHLRDLKKRLVGTPDSIKHDRVILEQAAEVLAQPAFDTCCTPPQPWRDFTASETEEIVDCINSYSRIYSQLGPPAKVHRTVDGHFHIEIEMVGGSLVLTKGSTGGTFRGYFNDTSG